jgi:hypothetical protein
MARCPASARARSCGSPSSRPTSSWPRRTAGPARCADLAWRARLSAANHTGSGAARYSRRARSSRRSGHVAVPRHAPRPRAAGRAGTVAPPLVRGTEIIRTGRGARTRPACEPDGLEPQRRACSILALHRSQWLAAPGDNPSSQRVRARAGPAAFPEVTTSTTVTPGACNVGWPSAAGISRSPGRAREKFING